MNMNNIQKLAQAIKSHERIVFFGGAGVSTESGVPDFRSADGIFNNNESAETLLSYSYFKLNPTRFMEFYRTKLFFPDVKPNFAHNYLAKLEKAEKLHAVITQNVDGLHQKAGSGNVIELHGTAHKCFCDLCKEAQPAVVVNEFVNPAELPFCKCGGVIRPAIIMYEEPLDPDVTGRAIRAIAEADMLIIAGTSLRVYPAASYIGYFTGNCLAVINREAIAAKADIVIEGSVGETFKKINIILRERGF
ncbi:MAG: NAD-dependent protein deacylase [Oscillospiraceae bacterium]|nr:NAD-dependent protein deacylase [Oscillospiraceae bacterium]